MSNAFFLYPPLTETRNSLLIIPGGSGFRIKSEMVGEAELRSENLNQCFERLMTVAGGNSGIGGGISEGGVKMEGVVITEWKDIPIELLLRIVSLVDDRTVIMASGVCSGWRDALCLGLTHLSLSWY